MPLPPLVHEVVSQNFRPPSCSHSCCALPFPSLLIMSKTKLFVDPISPVCRAVMLFAAANKIPYQEVHVSLHKRWYSREILGSWIVCVAPCRNDQPIFVSFLCSAGETLTNEQLAAINPNKTIPAMDDDGFGLYERWDT